jgi:hypothetical protein
MAGIQKTATAWESPAEEVVALFYSRVKHLWGNRSWTFGLANESPVTFLKSVLPVLADGGRLWFWMLPRNAKKHSEFGDKLMSGLDLEPKVFNFAEI